jgi:hypothetical protein
MSCIENQETLSYWTLRRKLNSRVNKHITDIENHENCCHSAIENQNSHSAIETHNSADAVELETEF